MVKAVYHIGQKQATNNAKENKHSSLYDDLVAQTPEIFSYTSMKCQPKKYKEPKSQPLIPRAESDISARREMQPEYNFAKMRETPAEGTAWEVEIYATSYRKHHRRKGLERVGESRTDSSVIIT